MFKALTALLLVVGLSFGAQAAPTAVTPAMAALPFEHIGDFTSQPGEDIKAFMLRIAPTLAAYTHRTGWEACGTIGKAADGTYGMALGSNHSQIGCLAGEAGVLEGMTWTGETIHSHPENGELSLTPIDHAYAIAAEGSNLPGGTFEGSPGGFSATDCAGPAGYLVANGRLLYRTSHGCHGIHVGAF